MRVTCGMDDCIHGRACFCNACLENIGCRFEACIELIATKRITRIEHDESIVQRAEQPIPCRVVLIQVLRGFQCYPGQDHELTCRLVDLHYLALPHVKFVEWLLLLKSTPACPAMKGEQMWFPISPFRLQ